MSNMDGIMDNLDWKAVDTAIGDVDGNIPHVTHTGVLEITGIKMKCYRLSNGKTIIDSEDVNKLFGGEL